METEIKKRKHRKGGTDYAKEKLAKAEAENKTLKDLKTTADKFAEEWKNRYFKKKEELAEAETTIEQQSRKISQLTADLKVAQGNLEATDREHKRQLKAMYDHMGWFKRMTWDRHHAPTFKEDEQWNETH